MTYIANSGIQILELGVDFQRLAVNSNVSGTPVGVYELTNRGSAGRLPVGAIVMDAFVWADGAASVQSGAQVKLGYEGNDDYYMGLVDLSQVPASFCFSVKEFARDGITEMVSYDVGMAGSDGPFLTEYRPNIKRISSISESKVLLTVTGNTVNSGKLIFAVQYYLPSLTSLS
jgi:hypothetical protein